MKVLAIAINTFREAVRNRVLYVLLFFSILIMMGAWVASTLSIDQETKIIRDLGAGAINFISLLIAVFVGIGLVYNDLDKKTIYTIISKPISRWEFLMGKYLGLMLTISVNVLIMTWIFASVLHFRFLISPEQFNQAMFTINADGLPEYRGTFAFFMFYAMSIIKAILFGVWHIISLGFDGTDFTAGLFAVSMLTIFEMSVIVGAAILFSTFTTPTLSAFLTVVTFIIGRLNQDLYLFAEEMVRRAGGLEQLSAGQTVAYHFATTSSYLLPNLEIFNRRREFGQFEPIVVSANDLAYGVVYVVLVLTLATMIFNRRNFK